METKPNLSDELADYHDTLVKRGIANDLLTQLVIAHANHLLWQQNTIAQRDSLLRLVQGNLLTETEARDKLRELGDLA